MPTRQWAPVTGKTSALTCDDPNKRVSMRYALLMSAPARRPARVGRPRTPETNLVLVPLKLPPMLRRRFKVAAAEEGTTYAGLLTQLLDAREEQQKRRAAQMASPLHRPKQPRLADLELPGR